MTDRFYIWPLLEGEPTAIDPSVYRRETPVSDIHNFCEICERLSEHLSTLNPSHPPLTFLVTWRLDAWDARLDDAIVFLIGDERYQTPGWASRGKIVFKTGGAKPNPVSSVLGLPGTLAARILIRHARDSLIRLRRRGITRDSRGVVLHELPLGTHMLTDLPPVPFAQRTADVFFAGSIAPGGTLTLRPSVKARLMMADAVRAAQKRLPGLSFECSIGAQLTHAPGTYSQRLSNARIALCPRGNFDETFRLFEAAKMGCVIVCDRLPTRWYYAGLPAVELGDWATLGKTLEALFADPAALAERSARTRTWWESTVSPEAIARWAAAQVNAVLLADG